MCGFNNRKSRGQCLHRFNGPPSSQPAPGHSCKTRHGRGSLSRTPIGRAEAWLGAPRPLTCRWAAKLPTVIRSQRKRFILGGQRPCTRSRLRNRSRKRKKTELNAKVLWDFIRACPSNSQPLYGKISSLTINRKPWWNMIIYCEFIWVHNLWFKQKPGPVLNRISLSTKRWPRNYINRSWFCLCQNGVVTL